MVENPTVKGAVILVRERVESRWASTHWQLVGVIPDTGGEPRTLVETPDMLQRLYPGFDLTIYADEAEGYYLNVSTEAPSVFVSIRYDEAGDAYPFQCTLSYNEAARWMDGSERVERALAWPELTAWLGQWVAANYRPERKKRQRPSSFEGKEGQFREIGDS